MGRPLMPKATALWLIRHTSLTMDQIAQFCGFHPLEISVLAESESLQEMDPIAMGQLSQDEIIRCEADPHAHLTLQTINSLGVKTKKKYVPLSKRSEIPHAILWIVRHYPHITDTKICSFLSTTKNTVKKIREGKHWNIKNLTPKDPVVIGLCSQEEFDDFIKE